MSLVKFAVVFTMYAQAQDGAPVDLPTVQLPPMAQKGRASWYGDGQWHGDVTASGEVFNPHDTTCAHRELPFDTVVLIENPANGHRAWCRINDRGPYGALNEQGDWNVVVRSLEQVQYRGILDMSIATAQRLETINVGLRHVLLHYWPPKSYTFDLAVWSPASSREK